MAKSVSALLPNRIDYYRKVYGFSREELAAALRFTTRTLHSRMKCPRTMTIGELEDLSKKMHVPLEKLLFGDIA